MNDIAIRCDGLGKQYRLGERESYRALRDTITRAMSSPFRRVRAAFDHSDHRAEDGDKKFWALKDLSFEVKRGEVVGIIGHNGAGKSTLLKILSRITAPTTGEVEIRGRVGSLLEVGTGFHPELTGRENIFLNGAILGMKRADIARKFDEIVAFAEIDRFIDTPVKRYSSGMYVRLAFAVAVHMEPEILLVDEVLAVGDAQFQKKCFEKMRAISKGERTIIFVSHNMYAVRHICDRGFMLEGGCIVEEGRIDDVVDRYMLSANQSGLNPIGIETDSFIVNKVEISSTKGPVIKTFDPVEIKVRLTAKRKIDDPGLYVGVLNSENQRLTGLDFKDFLTIPSIQAGQSIEMGFFINALPLLAGSYKLELHLKDLAANRFEFVPQMFPFEVVETPVYGGRKLDRWYGFIGLDAQAIACSPPIEVIPE